MNTTEENVRFVKVSSEALRKFMEEAKNQVIIAKPGYTMSEVDLLEALAIKKGINCTVYVDPDENSVRWGFGENDSLQKLYENMANLNLKTG
ncbi:MAG: hypothetical protein JRJ77_05730 [Deltaproteobacteria bacterium]|nr:hypothetical protein [Deltaproteobacteria bacterium]